MDNKERVLTPEEEPSRDEVLCLFGQAVYSASRLERTIALLVSGNDTARLDGMGRDRYAFFLEEDVEKRFSRLLDRISMLVPLDGTFETDLRLALRERNRLLHGFWWERARDMETGRGRSILRNEITGLVNLFDKLRCYLEGKHAE